MPKETKECVYHIIITMDTAGLIMKNQIDIQAKDAGPAMVKAVETWQKYRSWYFLGDALKFECIGSTPLYKYQRMPQRKWLGKLVPLYGDDQTINLIRDLDDRVKALNRTPEEEGVMV